MFLFYYYCCAVSQLRLGASHSTWAVSDILVYRASRVTSEYGAINAQRRHQNRDLHA